MTQVLARGYTQCSVPPFEVTCSQMNIMICAFMGGGAGRQMDIEIGCRQTITINLEPTLHSPLVSVLQGCPSFILFLLG